MVHDFKFVGFFLSVLKKKLKPKEVKNKLKKPGKAKLTSTKKPVSGNTVGLECSGEQKKKQFSCLLCILSDSRKSSGVVQWIPRHFTLVVSPPPEK